jgi:hypothetical protein
MDAFFIEEGLSLNNAVFKIESIHLEQSESRLPVG